jgi:hypothetical protein
LGTDFVIWQSFRILLTPLTYIHVGMFLADIQLFANCSLLVDRLSENLSTA